MLPFSLSPKKPSPGGPGAGGAAGGSSGGGSGGGSSCGDGGGGGGGNVCVDTLYSPPPKPSPTETTDTGVGASGSALDGIALRSMGGPEWEVDGEEIPPATQCVEPGVGG